MAGSIRVTPVGLAPFVRQVTKTAAALPAAFGDELYRDMVQVMFDSQAIVPYDEGDLHDSGEVDRADVNGGRVSVLLHYGSGSVDYALIQHEDLTLRHPNGGQAKFLETPFMAWTGNGPQAVAQRALRRAAR